MTVSVDCELKIYSVSDWEEIENPNEIKIQNLVLKRLDDLSMLCKHKGKKIITATKTAASTKGSVFSIITGLALIGLGAVISLACPPAGAIISGTGISLVASAVVNEINDAAEPTKPKSPQIQPPSGSHPNEIEYGGTISITMPI
jgi:predicted phage tail protein